MDLLKGIENYIMSGETTKERLGLEIEHFVVDEKGFPIEFNRITTLIRDVAVELNAEIDYTDGYVVGYSNDEYSITLEPACQLEISINPHASLASIEKIYEGFTKLFEPRLQEMGYHFVMKGVLPLVELSAITPDELTLSPKKRYEYMDRYFEDTGKCGKYMMRSTAATQVSVDYKNEKDLIRKLVILEKISPILMIMFENKKRHNSVIKGVIDKPHLFRTQIWDDVDPNRAGFFPGSLLGDFSYKRIAKEVYNLPLILLTDEGNTRYVGSKSAKDLVEDNIINEDEVDDKRGFSLIEHFLSMGFYHFRIKKYIEIRVVDALPIDKALGFASLIKGIVYSNKNIDVLLDELSDIDSVDKIKDAIITIEEDGLDAVIYNNKTAEEWAEYLTKLALSELIDEERKYLRV